MLGYFRHQLQHERKKIPLMTQTERQLRKEIEEYRKRWEVLEYIVAGVKETTEKTAEELDLEELLNRAQLLGEEPFIDPSSVGYCG
jgi:hypothetical protein